MTFEKRFGAGYYTAHFVGRSNLIKLTAAGVLPCSNYLAALEQRPERVAPPNWNMIFLTEPYLVNEAGKTKKLRHRRAR